MKIKFIFLALFVLCFSKLHARTYDITVALDSSGDYTSIQDAIDAAPENSTDRTLILIKDGTYNTEKLLIPSNKKNISLIGESREGTIISYHLYDCDDGKCPTEDAALWSDELLETSATLTIEAEGFIAKNLTIENTAGAVGQAQAITVTADKAVFINCDLTGYQDTIYFRSNGNRSYFQNCMVLGRTDYIYGSGLAFFDRCEIQSYGGGYITAPSTSVSDDYGFVFYECDLTYNDNSPRTGDDGSTIALGRPWHNYPKVTWIYCEMTDMIDPKGWTTSWNMEYASTSDSLELYEYGNTGAGADMDNRSDWKGIRELTDDEAPLYERAIVLAGTDNWDPLKDTIGVTINAFDTIEAEDFDFQSGIKSENCDDGSKNIGYIQDGDLIGFSNVDFGNGAVSFSALAATTTDASITIMLDDTLTGTIIGTCPLSSTGSFSTYNYFTCNINSISGVHNLFLLFSGGDGYLFNLNSFSFTEAQSSKTAATLTLHGDDLASQTIEYGDSITEFYYSWENATTATVSGMPRGLTTTIDSDKQTISFSGVPSMGGTFNFTINTVGSIENTSESGTINVVTIDTARLTKKGLGSLNQTVRLGYSIIDFYFKWDDASSVDVNGLPAGITATIDTNEQTVTIEGTPTETGIFPFTVTTVGADVNVSANGTITVKDGSSSDDETSVLIQEENIITSPKIYPNPVTNNELTILFDAVDNNTKIDIYSLVGTLIYSKDITESKTILNLNIPSGNYLMQITSKKQSFVKKLIIN